MLTIFKAYACLLVSIKKISALLIDKKKIDCGGV